MYFILGQAWGLDKNLLSAMCLGHPRNVSYTFYSVPDGTIDSLDTAVLSEYCIFHRSTGSLDTVTALLVW